MSTWSRTSATTPMPMNPARRRPTKDAPPAPPEGGDDGLCLFGDLAPVKHLFKPRPKKSVTLGMARSLKAKVAKQKHGLGGFLESAIMSFDGCLPALWTAAQQFCECRRFHEPEDGIENATARISATAFERLDAVLTALRKGEVLGVTRARVLSGLVELRLRAEECHPSKGESQ